jgi:cytochrome oxidase assembly protein ShyY1
LDWYQTIFEVIDMRSFSNLWYWIGLAVLWSSTSHWVLGVPFDMVTRARRSGGSLNADMETLAHINVKRLLYIVQTAGIWLVGFATFVLVSLGILSFVYDMEFAQAVLFMAAPMTLVAYVTYRTAQAIAVEDSRGAALIKRISRCRMIVQVIGMLAILATSMFGMWQNLSTLTFPGY